jgi:hypothetical protein
VTNEPLLSNPKCVILRNHFFESANFEDYPTEQLTLLLDHLREYSAYCALNRNYEDAERGDALAMEVRNEVGMRSEEVWEIDDLSLEKFEGVRELHEEDLKSELELFDIATEERRAALLKQLAQERDEFERRWGVDLPPKYRKPSQKLILLYEIERQLGITGQFTEAKRAKHETEALERQETETAQRLLMRDYELACQQFAKNQSSELAMFDDKRREEKEVILARHKVRIGLVGNRRNVLEQKKMELRVPKENSVRPPVKRRQSAGNAAVYRREMSDRTGCLLPPLKAPNDESMIELRKRERKEQQKKNQRFREYLAQKEREADSSGSEIWDRETPSISASSEDDSESSLSSASETPKFEQTVFESGESTDVKSDSDVRSANSTPAEAADVEWVDQADVCTQITAVRQRRSDDANGSPTQTASRSETFDLTQTDHFRADAERLPA